MKKFSLKHPVMYAPLAGCTDFPFRQMSARYGPALQYCEMVKIDPLVRHDKTTLRMLDYDESMRPIGAQICGSKPKMAGEAARIVEDLGFDVIDLNCGCPVDKVTKDGSGSGMLKNPERIGEVLSEVVANVSIPVTVKIRSGWDQESICTPEVTKIAEAAGAQAIAIHGRTRQQAYRGDADWSTIKAAKEVANKIKVIGNGDVYSPEAAKRMLDETGCDAVLIARGMLGNPWIVDDILKSFEGKQVVERTIEDYRQALFEHFQFMKAYYAEKHVIINMRRIGCWYVKRTPRTKEFRQKITRAESLGEIEDLILNFSFAK